MHDHDKTILGSGDSFNVSPVNVTDGDIPYPTQYKWSVVDNPNVTGQSDQVTPIDSISQTLSNISDSVRIVIYVVTPVTDGCDGSNFEISGYYPKKCVKLKVLYFCKINKKT